MKKHGWSTVGQWLANPGRANSGVPGVPSAHVTVDHRSSPKPRNWPHISTWSPLLTELVRPGLPTPILLANETSGVSSLLHAAISQGQPEKDRDRLYAKHSWQNERLANPILSMEVGTRAPGSQVPEPGPRPPTAVAIHQNLIF